MTRVLAVWPAERWLGRLEGASDRVPALEVRGAGVVPSSGELAWADVVVALVGPDAPAPDDLGDSRVLWLVPAGPEAVGWAPSRPGTLSMLSASADAGQLAAAIVAVSEGLWVWDAELSSGAARHDEDELGAEALTPREREILGLVSAGLSNRAIAERLGVSAHTVKSHVGAVLAKLGAESRTEAVALAARRGWVSL